MAYHALGGELVGATGTWAYVRGGMGAVTQDLARVASEAGAEIRTGASVRRVLVDGGRATGVELAGGAVIRSALVVSNADPKTTFAKLVDLGHLVAGWPTPGTVVKVNLALEELPDFVSVPGTAPGPQHRGTVEISPSVDALQRAFEEAETGVPSREPFMEVFLQSAVDDSLAPSGRHVLSAFTQYAPQAYEAADWPRLRAEAEANVLRTLASHAPNIPDAIVARDVLGPPELEERFGLAGGNIFHGEILPERCFGDRFDYRTPVAGLYLCGSGARPGGGVMGAAGRNAARTVLADLSC
jgi:phytoene dehydrogenase-like protein